MKIFTARRGVIAAAVILTVITVSRCSKNHQIETGTVTTGKLEVWARYTGTIQPRNLRNIVSDIRGSATLTEITPDGTIVTQGMPVARFDASRWEDDMLEAEKNLLLAKADYESLVHAKLPIEINDLEYRLMKAKQLLEDEKKALADTRDLFEEGLVPEHEVKQMQIKVSAVETEIDGLVQTIDLTRRYLQPAARQRAQASLDSASNAFHTISRRIERSVVPAPCNGIVVHKQINIGNEYRAPRTGDTIWYTQVFMTITDMSDLIASCSIPEPELTQISPGAPVLVHPVAYPAMRLTGTVATVGSMARQLPGQPDGAKFFDVTVTLNETSDLLRSDMSAAIYVLSYQNDNALLIPRSAVWWEQGRSYANVVSFGNKNKTPVLLGRADNFHFELLDGIEPGRKVVIR